MSKKKLRHLLLFKDINGKFKRFKLFLHNIFMGTSSEEWNEIYRKVCEIAWKEYRIFNVPCNEDKIYNYLLSKYKTEDVKNRFSEALKNKFLKGKSQLFEIEVLDDWIKRIIITRK
jgi:hypothetical protein